MATNQLPAVTVARIVERPAGVGATAGPLWRRTRAPAPGAMVTSPLWRTRDYAARSAARFNKVVDRHAGRVPAALLATYRAAYDAAPEEAQIEFLIGVAGRLTLRLAEDGPDPITRAAALLTEWFLAPR